MTEKEGHFEKGKWVEDEAAAGDASAGSANENPGETFDDFDEKITELRSSVSKNLNDIFGIGKALITTEKGREHLAKKMKKAEEKIDRTIEDFAEGFEKAMKR